MPQHWSLVGLGLVGWTLVQAGTVPAADLPSVLCRGLLGVSVSVLCWWAVGFGGVSGFGHGSYSLDVVGARETAAWGSSAASLVYCIIIVAGSRARRMPTASFCVVAATTSCLTFPVCLRSLHHAAGWMSPCSDSALLGGALDVGGAASVHVVAGFQTLSLAVVARRWKWRPAPERSGSAAPRALASAGSFLFLTSIMSLLSEPPVQSGRVVSVHRSVIPILVGCSTATVVGQALLRWSGSVPLYHFALCGAVSVSGAPPFYDLPSAAVVGALGAGVFLACVRLLRRLRVDDASHIVAAHGGCGLWALVAAGIFVEDVLLHRKPSEWAMCEGSPASAGLVSGGGNLLLAQLVGGILVAVWSSTVSGVVCAILQRAEAVLRAERPLRGTPAELALTDRATTAFEDPPRLGRRRKAVAWRLSAVVTAMLVFIVPHTVAHGEVSRNETAEAGNSFHSGGPRVDLHSLFMYGMVARAGFAFFEAGCVSSCGSGESAVDVLQKNLTGFALGVWCWWAAGFGIALGSGSAGIGKEGYFFLVQDHDSNSCNAFVVSCLHVTLTGVLSAGAVAGRLGQAAYLILVGVTCTLTLPLLLRWLWSTEGWLSPSNGDGKFANGMVDFGGAAIHVGVGVLAVVLTLAIGPCANGPDPPADCSRLLQVIGTFLLWAAWSLPSPVDGLLHTDFSPVWAVVAASSAAVTSVFLAQLAMGTTDVLFTCKSIVGALVAVSASGPLVEVRFSVLIGAVASLVVGAAGPVRAKLRMDDATDAIAVHGVCGIWGLTAVGLFGGDEHFQRFLGGDRSDYGLLLGGGGRQLGAQLLGVLVIVAWTGATGGLMCLVLSRTLGLRAASDSVAAARDVTVGVGPGDTGPPVEIERASVELRPCMELQPGPSPVAEICELLARGEIASARRLIVLAQEQDGGAVLASLRKLADEIQSRRMLELHVRDWVADSAEESFKSASGRVSVHISLDASSASRYGGKGGFGVASPHDSTSSTSGAVTGCRDASPVRRPGGSDAALRQRNATTVEFESGISSDTEGELRLAFCGVVCNTAQAHGGAIHFIGGDRGVLSFGERGGDPSSKAKVAVVCCLQIQDTCRQQIMDGQVMAPKMVTGITSGQVLSGEVGAARLPYCDDTSMAATRRALVALARHCGTSVLTDARTSERVQTHIEMKPVDILSLANHIRFVAYTPTASPTSPEYWEAFRLLEAGDMSTAVEMFQALPQDEFARRLAISITEWPKVRQWLADELSSPLALYPIRTGELQRYAAYFRHAHVLSTSALRLRGAGAGPAPQKGPTPQDTAFYNASLPLSVSQRTAPIATGN
eukprot:TRINITY_DN19161_c0_g1_i2.p1 TRINITY_DN19161_c0_g1~~TRINITY_DN19161_c0_g1_i2.p1  ORF type:complete len:1316 (+),score=276.21 TRINITY_DN19161_c0_g1_i2:51-3998(+)